MIKEKKAYLEKVMQEYDRLADETRILTFREPVAYVYRPLDYAREAHQSYLRQYLSKEPRVVFMGMNPGPFGMAQTGIPFGEVGQVREWLNIHAGVYPPECTHPKKPVMGFACQRSEVSGRRLWALFRQRYGSTERFFSQNIVINYCPLLFLRDSGANLTPVQLSLTDQRQLTTVCDESLRRLMHHLNPVYLVGIGQYAAQQARKALADTSEIIVSSILHPSPANPQANRNWAGTVENTLIENGIWL